MSKIKFGEIELYSDVGENRVLDHNAVNFRFLYKKLLR